MPRHSQPPNMQAMLVLTSEVVVNALYRRTRHSIAAENTRVHLHVRRLAHALATAGLFLAMAACGSLDREAQREVVERVGSVLRERYVFPEMGARLDSSLREAEARGDFVSATAPGAFADALSGHIRELSGDGHLWVEFNPGPYPEPEPEPGAEVRAEDERRRRLARANFGFDEARILAGNVGYLSIGQFVDPVLAGDAAAEAMTVLANTDALILDLRESEGGSAEMVVLLASYLLEPEPVHLFDTYFRPRERTVASYSLREVAGPRLAHQPVFVLTRRSTFSAGEGLAYVLKHLGRATVVGEQTGGGAHRGRFHRVSAEFVVFVAEARVTSPVTGENWEGRGVRPHVEATAIGALDVAHRLAIEALARRE